MVAPGFATQFCDAAPLVLAERRRRIARMVEQRLDGLGISVVRQRGAGEHLGPFLGGILEPQPQRVHANLLRQNIEHALHREGAHRRARRAIGRDLRTVANHVVADRARIRKALGGQGCSPGPGHYPVEEVAELLAELKASGDFDRILAETTSDRGRSSADDLSRRVRRSTLGNVFSFVVHDESLGPLSRKG